MLPGHNDADVGFARLLSTLERLLELEAIQLRPALDRASRLVCDALGADKVDVLHYEAATGSLVATGTSDAPMGRRQHAVGLDRLPVDSGGRAVGVYGSGLSFLTGHADRGSNEPAGIARGLKARSEMICPLIVAGERRGVLQAASATEDLFSVDDLRFLEAVARWVGLIIQRAELVERIAGEAEERGHREAIEGTLSLLTPRQRQIAALIAAGLTNEQIAEQLVVTAGTVANHVQRILAKLGLANRTQIATWAAERGLHRPGSDESPRSGQVNGAR